MHPSEYTLNEYAEGTLGSAERVEVERHLETCDVCRRTVAELADVTREVRALPPLTPPDFQTIARAVQADGGERTVRRGSPERLTWLAAAAVILIAVGVAWQVRSGRNVPPPPVPAATAQSVESELRQAEEHYQKAITGLEQIANSEQGQLDPQTAATLQKNLSVIDQAIGESRAALKQQPTSEPAQQSLLENFKTKLALLEDTVALINEMRKGNEAGAARIASGLKKKG